MEPLALSAAFTRNNTSNTRRWATNADSRTARRYGEARNPDARNTVGMDVPVSLPMMPLYAIVMGDSGRHKHQRANYSGDEANSM